MGFIQAFKGTISGTLADQWKDYYVPMENIPGTAAIFRAVLKGQNAGRGSNVNGSENIITNGSKIVVPEGTALITLEDGKITNFIAEAGGYTYQSNDPNSQAFVAANGLLSALKVAVERFKFG